MATELADGSWEIQGHRVRFPVRIEDASVACAAFVVPTARAASVLAGTGLAPVSVAGRTPAFLLLVDYRRSDLGAYDEVGLAVLARAADGTVGPCILELPVTQPFTMEAGRTLWGLPKWLARAELGIGGNRASCHLAEGEHHVLTAALRTVPLRLPVSLPGAITALSPVAGAVLLSRASGRARGLRLGLGGTTVILGRDHRMARRLTELGLPRRALVTAIVDHVAFELGPSRRVPA